MKGLRLGLGLSGGSSFSPASLFTGAAGAWYDPSDLSTLFQDTAGTTPVTAAGQSVALLKDKSGNGLHLSQATAGSQPTYQVDGNGHPYLLFDGVDDLLFNAAGIVGNNQSFGVAQLTTTGANFLWQCVVNGTTDRIALVADVATGTTIARFNNSSSTGAGKQGSGSNGAVVDTVEVDKVGVTLGLRENGVDQPTSSTTTPGVTVGCYLGNAAAGTRPFGGNVYGLVHLARAFAGNERARLETWLGAKCGLTL